MKHNENSINPDLIEQAQKNNDSRGFGDILRARLSRRDALRGSLGFAAVSMFAGAGIAGCNSDSSSDSTDADSQNSDLSLSFKSVANNTDDKILVPEGYEAQILAPWGTPLLPGAPAFSVDNDSAAQALQVGDGHDGIYMYPPELEDGVLPFPSPVTDSGIMCLNHEYPITSLLHRNGVSFGADEKRDDADQVRKEINAHGVSVIELLRSSGWEVVNSGLNRRITAASPVSFSGPAAGSALLQTKFSPDGTRGRGTLNNCGFGWTPWGTYLACEENFRGYLVDERGDAIPEEKKRYSINGFGFGYRWFQLEGDASEVDGEFARWNTTPTGASAADDYRNEANQFGYVVEIDPYDPSSTPVKRTAMGRFAHEGAMPSPLKEGRKIAFYMGDDARDEYCYKYVTSEAWDPARVSELRGTMLDEGTLYVARFNEDGSGSWLPLDINDAVSGPILAEAGFTSQAEVCVYTRLAADALGATTMDRPEWSAVDPKSGEVYYTLTNNTGRSAEEVNAANPRPENAYGHIIKLREGQDDPSATAFNWEIFVFGGPSGGDPKHVDSNLSGLTLENQFASPDGLYFDHRGVLWIQTDNGGNKVGADTNDQMLAVIPAAVSRKEGAPAIISESNQAQIKRFFVGAPDCEVTGVFLTADSKTLFLNVQHPGDDGTPDDPKKTSAFPYDGSDRPRAAMVAITRTDGGDIAL